MNKRCYLMPVILKIITGILLMSYPFIVYFGLKLGSIQLLAPLLIILLSIRLCLLRINVQQLLWLARVGVVAGIILALLSWLFKSNHWLLYYPVVINLLFLLAFSYTLFNPPSIIEQLARLTEPDLPVQAIPYTQKVTVVWCGFFMINGSIALFTVVLGNLAWWTLYNGAISYALIGALIGSEWIVRQWIRRKQ